MLIMFDLNPVVKIYLIILIINFNYLNLINFSCMKFFHKNKNEIHKNKYEIQKNRILGKNLDRLLTFIVAYFLKAGP